MTIHYPHAYHELVEHYRHGSLLESTGSLLDWDQETTMPQGGGAVQFRARQIAQLAGLAHRMRTDKRIADWLHVCEIDNAIRADPLSAAAVNVREIRREYERDTKLPQSLVEEFSMVTTEAKSVWAEAKGRSDFAAFEPWLKRIVTLNRQRAECWGWKDGGETWDALAEGFEPGMNAEEVGRVFAPLRKELVELVGQLVSRGKPPNDRFNTLVTPIDAQRKFVRFVTEKIGFDFTRGRLDESSHPFCGGTHRDDVRMTTRFRPDGVADSLGSALHEAGHGMYEQHLPGGDLIGTPMGRAVSLSIHESQSRMIENQVGRSRAFWTWCHPKLREFFGSAVDGLTLDDVYGAANTVKPSLIRTESDEATYNLHIMIRFELERSMMSGDLSVADLPGAWNEKYRDYLGVEVPDHRRGCMQDIHWSLGAMGYFPTYTMGNLYAAQFFEKASSDIAGLQERFAHGDFAPLIDWLALHIHSQGMRYHSAGLCRHVTKQSLSAEPLLRHLREKLRPIYGL